MAATRRNIATDAGDATRFVTGVSRLKNEQSGLTTVELNIAPSLAGTHTALSTWDLFVVWHVRAMERASVDGRRNAAHSGPVFLPWHRWYLLVLEFHLRRVLELGPDDFGLPYWDWASDGSAFDQAGQRLDLPLWTIIGGNGQGPLREVLDGPFTVANGFPINVETAPNGQLRAASRALRRNFGDARDQLGQLVAPTLPTKDREQQLSRFDVYDIPTWERAVGGFRDELEGWSGPSTPGMHNRVHVWVGGDMGPGTSPNDPVFFLNHCNVDRIWAAWQAANPALHSYRPTGTSAPDSPLYRHRSGDPLLSIFSASEPAVGAMEAHQPYYNYA